MFFLIGQAISTLNYYVATFLPPAVVALGGLGNIFSLLVFILSPLRKLRSSPFLIGLTTSHLVALTCIFLVWLERVGIFLVGQQGWCQVLNYLFHVANFLGVAFVLCFTVERYISFCWNKSSTIRGGVKSRMHRNCVAVTIALVVIVGLYFSFLLGLLKGKKEICTFVPLPGYNLYTKKVPKYILHFSNFIIPIMLLVTLGLDISIMITILRRKQINSDESPKFSSNGADSRSLQKDFGESVDNLSIGHADDLTGRDNTMGRSQKGTLPRPLRIIRSREGRGELRRSRSLLSIRSTINATRMLFAASLTFTVMQMFFAGIQFFQAVVFYGKMSFTPNQTLYNLFAALYMLSLGVGFIIYMFCGRNFREAVKMLLTCQYGRCFAHCKCNKQKSKHQPPIIRVNGGEENGHATPVASDSVSRYIDDASHYSVR